MRVGQLEVRDVQRLQVRQVREEARRQLAGEIVLVNVQRLELVLRMVRAWDAA